MTTAKVLLSIASIALLCGYANIAASPKVLRQTYEDGTFTEVECYRPSETGRQDCVFRIGAGDRIAGYKFTLDDYGYSSMFVMDSYNFWPNGRPFPPDVLFQVTCLEADLQLVPGANLDNARCNIILSADGTKLTAERVSIFALVDGVDSHAYRKPTPIVRS